MPFWSKPAARGQERLQRIRQQWAPTVVEPVRPQRVHFGGWNRLSGRGFVVLMCSVLLLAGWWWWSGRPQELIAAPEVLEAGLPVTGIDADSVTSTVVVVHVVGAVRKPGLVELPMGSRVSDAIEAAGGVRNDKALASVNLARLLVDGEQVVLDPSGQVSAGEVPTGTAGNQLNLNQASAADLVALPGVGPVIAERIVTWRTTNGPFRSIDELGEVSGIGDAILRQVRPLLRL
jgi:competence protein ComEA